MGRDQAKARPAAGSGVAYHELPGDARDSLVPSYQELLDEDRGPVPDTLRQTSFAEQGSDDIALERYYSREFHDLEVEKIWKRVWQMACRVEDIPDVGDTCVYQIADISLIIVRAAPDQIKAYYNACLHRGRALRDSDGWTPEFRCPFHGFTWNLDGTLKWIPSKWDFPTVEPERFCLPEAAVDTWGGFVFVNMDKDCEPLEAFLGRLPEVWGPWPLEGRVKSVHVVKVLRANWKVVQEAFMEALHAFATHPQMVLSLGDTNSQIDLYPGENFSRLVTTLGTQSSVLPYEASPDDIVACMLRQARGVDVPDDFALPEGTTARRALADMARGSGGAAKEVSDTELLDAILYTLFPNLTPWGGPGRTLCYRFRPYGNDPDMSIMDVMYLSEVAPGEPRPEVAKPVWVSADESFAVPELGILGHVLDQDTSNVMAVQRALRSAQKPGATLARYQEARIRHIHELIDKWIDS